MHIPIIVETEFNRESIWNTAICEGMNSELARKKYHGHYIDIKHYKSCDYDALFVGKQRRIVAVVGTQASRMQEIIDFFAANAIELLIISYEPPENSPVRGTVRIDYAAGVVTLLEHLRSCGCTKTALYGCFVDSPTDCIKRRAFEELTDGETFENRTGLADCYREFYPRINDFDSVICVNDIVAASLINRLRGQGIRVPEDIEVACMGNLDITKHFRPSVTSVGITYSELGRQAVNAYAFLAKSEENTRLTVQLAGKLTVRETTKPLGIAVAPLGKRNTGNPEADFYRDNEVQTFMKLERLLAACDETDHAILRALLDGETTDTTAEKTALAPETVRYRMRRLATAAGVKTRADLLSYIKANGFSAIFGKNE